MNDSRDDSRDDRRDDSKDDSRDDSKDDRRDATDEQTHRKFASRDMWINRSFTLNELEKYTMIALRLCRDNIGNFPE